MADYFLGQIMLAGYNFAPKGFAMCNGQLLPISQNQALFALLGTYYGGNGINNFQLPNLMGRTPLGAVPSVDGSWQPTPVPTGTSDGTETVTLTTGQLPTHNHLAMANTTQTGGIKNPTNGIYGAASEALYAQDSGNTVPLNASQLSATGGGLPHENMQPYNVVNFCIAMTGVFPSRS